MFTVDKPGTPAEILEHHGVKGQKWGVRQKFRSENPTSSDKKKAIRSARSRQDTRADTMRSRSLSKSDRQKAKSVYLKNPDRATSLRLTRGEKVVIGLLTGGVGLGGIYGFRRHVERKQARGGYK
jgi:hypothetical protein